VHAPASAELLHRRLDVDRMPEAHFEGRRPEMLDVALAAAQERQELRSEHRIVHSQSNHRPPFTASPALSLAGGEGISTTERRGSRSRFASGTGAPDPSASGRRAPSQYDAAIAVTEVQLRRRA